MSNYNGVSADDFIKAIIEFSKNIPPITEQEINLINLNPSISWLDKIKIKRKMRKMIKYDK